MDIQEHLLSQMAEMSKNIKDLTVCVARLEEAHKDTVEWSKKNTKDLEEHKKENEKELAPLKAHKYAVEGAAGLGSVLTIALAAIALGQRVIPWLKQLVS